MLNVQTKQKEYSDAAGSYRILSPTVKFSTFSDFSIIFKQFDKQNHAHYFQLEWAEFP